MQLTNPVGITPRLLPGVQVGNGWIAIDYAGVDPNGRDIYHYYIDLQDYTHHGVDLYSGCQGGSLQEGLSSLLSFLDAWVEALQHQGSENANLFPQKLQEWAVGSADEIGMLSYHLKETENLILE